MLGGVGALPEAAVARLSEIIAGGDRDAAIFAAGVLGGVGALPEAAVVAMLEFAAGSAPYSSRCEAIDAIASTSPTEQSLTSLLLRLTDEDNDVRKSASRALVTFAENPSWNGRIRAALVEAAQSPDYAAEDRYERRPAQDYAYDALWSVADLRSSQAQAGE